MLFKHFDKNIMGRDFVCGDIHGCFDQLENKLKEIKFNKQIDRMFCVGDLTDRGPLSHKATEYLDEPWFFSVYGNHEDIIIKCYKNNTGLPAWHFDNGGEWILHQTEEWIQDYIKKIEQLPLVIQVGNDAGILHARAPEFMSWNNLINNLDNPTVRETLLWSRYDSPKYDDISVIYAGHKINQQITYYGSIKDIDTGAFMQHYGRDWGKLTVCQI